MISPSISSHRKPMRPAKIHENQDFMSTQATLHAIQDTEKKDILKQNEFHPKIILPDRERLAPKNHRGKA
jgi:hypothetical protein